jgi:hypothetical protein
VGVLLGAAFVVTGVLSAHRGLVRMDAETFAREGWFVYVPLAMTAMFVLALAGAVRWRRSRVLHSRFMACTALPLLDPVLARLLGVHGPARPFEFLYQVPAFLRTTAVAIGLARSVPAGTPGRAEFRGVAVAAVGLFALTFVAPHTRGLFGFAAWFRSVPLSP